MSPAGPQIAPPCRPGSWRARFIHDTEYLDRCIRQFFLARDVMGELRVFDARQEGDEVRGILNSAGLPVAGVARDGRVVACCRAEDLGRGPCESFAVPLTDDAVVAEEEPLLKVVARLGTRPFLLVRGAAGFSGVVTHGDLQKPPLRMLLFAVVSIIELRWQEWIHDYFASNDGWQACLAPARLEMARKLMDERNRNGWNLALADCLQFGDRATIILKTPELWTKTLFTSKNEAREKIRAIQRLRDDLAHSQDLLVDNWGTILDLAGWLEPALQQLKARGAAGGHATHTPNNTPGNGRSS